MTSSDAESWARLRIVQGESSAQVWELVASAGQTTLTVGSNQSSNWVVREEGVAPVHFSLHWDGATLRVADTFGAGNVRVDGVPVAQQWRPLAGRVRIDFGRAAIVIEASSSSVPSRSDAPHPLDPGSQPPPSAGGAPRQNLKSTLIGVSPLAGNAAPPVQATAVTPPPQKVSDHTLPADSFRPRRPSDSQRAAKPTLVGINVQAAMSASPSKPPSASPPAPAAGSAAPPSSPAPSARVPAGTLMGMGLAEAMAQVQQAQSPQRVGGASLGDGDQRTIQGFPAAGSSAPPPAAGQPNTGRRVTQAGVVREAPGVSPGAVARAPVRTVSSAPPGAPDPVGSRWQEVPGGGHAAELVDAPPSAHGVPQAVLVGEEADPRGPRVQSPAPSALPPGQHGARPRTDRFSDAPTQMRDVGSVEPIRPRSGGQPWAYVGIALLTALAYFAWLYLLDHL